MVETLRRKIDEADNVFERLGSNRPPRVQLSTDLKFSLEKLVRSVTERPHTRTIKLDLPKILEVLKEDQG